MSTSADRIQRYEDVVVRLAGALRAARLYAMTHPTVRDHVAGLHDAVQQLLCLEPDVIVGFVGGEVIADDTPLRRGGAYLGELSFHLAGLGINRILFERGVTADEVTSLVRAVADARGRTEADGTPAGPDDVDFLSLPRLRAGRIPIDTTAGRWGFSLIEVRRVYGTSVECARTVWDSTRLEGRPDLPAAIEAVEHLAEAVTSTGGLMLGLTAMKAHDEYTFTHMVNVAILAMAQGRALGLDGEPLRDLGLAGLLHDIGKVRTPVEILAKPSKLSDAEFDIMRRHPIDGAAMLRATTGMPVLVPIVAFEHHLRLDGTGYPAVTRPTLNLGTSLCGIADVYDAMRSKRGYQQAFPTDRIIEVMRRNDGRQFDQHLVRRFIDLMGVYPPSSVVQLASGEVAVVLQNDGPRPDRPSVRVVVDDAGVRLTAPETRQLWTLPEDDPLGVIVNVLDPAAYQLDAVEAMLPS